MKNRKIVQDWLDQIRLSNKSEVHFDILGLQKAIIADDKLTVHEKGYLLVETHKHKWGTDLSEEISSMGLEFEEPGYATMADSFEKLRKVELLLAKANNNEPTPNTTKEIWPRHGQISAKRASDGIYSLLQRNYRSI